MFIRLVLLVILVVVAGVVLVSRDLRFCFVFVISLFDGSFVWL